MTNAIRLAVLTAVFIGRSTMAFGTIGMKAPWATRSLRRLPTTKPSLLQATREHSAIPCSSFNAPTHGNRNPI